ncbi:MAG: low molecular weight protein-tyrosine-phosphatase [Pararhodobacter sp.]
MLCLCLGNICRSPTAEAVLRAHAARRGLALTIDSAGTGDWHVGEAPDPRMQRAARAQGFDLSGQRARQLAPRDFHAFDLILAMDARNAADAERIRPSAGQARVIRFLDKAGIGGDVPDPYHEGNFHAVVALIDRAAGAIVNDLEQG